MQAVAAAVGSSLTVIKEVVRPMSKQERWQARKYLIGRGERSIYPDARIAAQRLAQNNVAVEKAKLAQNVYNTTNPLAATPGVPEGWRDVSNDGGFLDGLGVRREMLYDNEISPGFLARVYAPDKAVFGDDMNPTVVFRGSRMPELPNGKLNAAKKIFIDRELPEIKNLEDWTNNFNQGRGAESAYYQRAVDIGSLLKGRVDISGHSLGGGLASAASMTSGKSGWTFNAAGLNSGTVEKYGGSLVGSEDIINAYRVKGEILTRLQEVDLRQDFIDVNGNLALLAAKEKISSHLPDAVGVKHTLDGGVGNMGDRHGIQQVIDCIEQEKDDDIATIGHRI
jgi:Putative lipase essential for disintegration of autophagic bodies inside the vacuole